MPFRTELGLFFVGDAFGLFPEPTIAKTMFQVDSFRLFPLSLLAVLVSASNYAWIKIMLNRPTPLMLGSTRYTNQRTNIHGITSLSSNLLPMNQINKQARSDYPVVQRETRLMPAIQPAAA